jgi:uncharacterized phage protein (TIGR02218 family)
MRPAPTALINWLATSRQLTAYDLWTFQLAGGETLRFSGASLALVVPGTCWASTSGSLNYSASATWIFALGPVFQRGRVKCNVGVEPQPLDVAIGAGPSDLIGTLTWQEAIYARLFDGATVELDRFFPGPGGPGDTSIGCIVWFYGLMGKITWGRTGIQMTVNTPLGALANIQMPRRIYGANCTHVFGGAMCAYNRTTGASQGNYPAGSGSGPAAFVATAQAGTTPTVIVGGLSNLSYIEGTIIGLAGANAGLTRTIKNIDLSGNITLGAPFVYPIALGDTFTALPGCDHTSATCQNVFQNLNRFGGFPYIPPPEAVI